MMKMQHIPGLAAACLLTLAPFPGAAETDEGPPAEAAPSEAATRDDAGLMLRHRDGRLSADIDNRPLREVVAALALELPIKVYIKDSIREEISQKAVFGRFEDLPVQSALREIFSNRNFVLKRAGPAPAEGQDSAEVRPIEIWFYGGTGAYSQLLAGTAPAKIDPPAVLARLGPEEDGADLAAMSDAELRDLARSASSETLRAHALIELGNRVESPDNVDSFVQGLEDDSKTVRWRALTQILGARQALSDEVYRRVIDEDPDPFLRKQALAVLVFKKRHAAEGLLSELKAGDDQRLSTYAQELLDWLAQQPRPPEP